MSIAFWYFWYLRFPTFLCSKTTHGELPMSEDMTFKSVPYKAEGGHEVSTYPDYPRTSGNYTFWHFWCLQFSAFLWHKIRMFHIKVCVLMRELPMSEDMTLAPISRLS